MTIPRAPRAFARDIWTEVDAAFEGFDEKFEKISGGTIKSPNKFPPYNVIQWRDNQVGLEVATAGFSIGELEVSVEDKILIIKGFRKATGGITPNYTHKGIAARDFTLQFTLGEYLEVVSSSYKDGLLRINLEKIIPDAKKPRKIDISADISSPVIEEETPAPKQLLTE